MLESNCRSDPAAAFRGFEKTFKPLSKFDLLSISKSVSKDKEIFLYCRSGNRSGKATKILIDAGYINAINAGSIQEASNLLKSKIIK